MVSVSSNNAARFVQRTAMSSSISVERQHYQVIENRIEPIGGDKFYIQRVAADTGDSKQESIHSPNSEGRIFNSEYQIYRQEVPNNGYSGRFIYCIGTDGTDNIKDDVKRVCILVLNQTIAEEELEGRPNFNYNATMFYINIPLQRATTGQLEHLSDIEFKRHITQASKEWNSFQEFVKPVPFNSGRLWEMPIQFTNNEINNREATDNENADREIVHLSIHEPLARPSVLNIVLQKYNGIGVSHILSIGSISD
jgi:hypothetical protein